MNGNALARVVASWMALAAAAAYAGDAGVKGAAPPVNVGSLSAILAKVSAPGARAVLVNVWATWCDPCREELPELLRFYREHHARGLRLVMVSADDADNGEQVARVLVAASRAAGLGAPQDPIAFIKGEDDTKFVDGIDPRWSGALPATFLYDAGGKRTHSWLGPVTYKDLDARVSAALTSSPAEPKTRANTTTNPTKGPAATTANNPEPKVPEAKSSRRRP